MPKKSTIGKVRKLKTKEQKEREERERKKREAARNKRVPRGTNVHTKSLLIRSEKGEHSTRKR